MRSSSEILAQIKRDLGPSARQALTPAYYALLEKLGNPYKKLPPVFHVAGTNGKGSTCAFLRAILEAAGYRVHVNTSPHLVRYHERIRLAGKLIGEEELVELLETCQRLDPEQEVSIFEIGTAVAFMAFARHPADFVILETGLGGRLDATNVIEKPIASLIARLSLDHRDFLGGTIEKIAFEKAGIMKPRAPCFASAQPDQAATKTLESEAARIGAKLFMGGRDWRVKLLQDGFRFEDSERAFDLPQPALLGEHQYQNAALAIAALSVLPKAVAAETIAEGLRKAEWPARLQRLEKGNLAPLVKGEQQLWLDGGHNDSAGEALGIQAQKWAEEDGANPRPLYLIYGMISTKRPVEFLQPLTSHVSAVRTVGIPNEAKSLSAEKLAAQVAETGIENVSSASSVREALVQLSAQSPRARILICGSLYLAGYVLGENETGKIKA